MNVFKQINLLIERTIFWMTACSTLIFVVFVLLSVITRYLTKTPILGSIEMSRLFFVWACFLAASLGYRRNIHIAITFIVDKLPQQWIRIIDIFIHSITVVFFAVIFKESLVVVKLLWFTHLPLSGLSQSWLYLPVPFLSLVIILFAIEKATHHFIETH
jgi:TRAP-type transport system small permease protein